MCRIAFSSPRRPGGFDSQDFLSFVRTANDITEIVFVMCLPGGLLRNRGGSRRVSEEGAKEGRGRNQDQTKTTGLESGSES